MIAEFRCTDEMWAEAAAQAKLQRVYDKSHRKFAANEVGCLGEVVAEMWMARHGVAFHDERHETTHDYRLHNGKTIDVKTKDRTVRPKTNFDCSVPLYNHSHQKPDYFLFVSLRRDKLNVRDLSIKRLTHAYVLGGVNYQQLEAWARNIRTGQVDPGNGTRFWTACKNISIAQLVIPTLVASKWRAESSASAV